MKHNIQDVTFLIPIRLDSVLRLENLMVTIQFLRSNFDCRIFVLEADSYNRHLIDSLCDGVEYLFVEDKDPVFHRTKYLNMMTRRADTTFLSIWDSDIIIPPMQIMEAVMQLRSDSYQIAYPYNGRFMETSLLLRAKYMQNRDWTFLVRNESKMQLLNNYTRCVGGAIFVNREKYIASGMENENFYGWGAEDDERYKRWEALGYRIYRSKGCLFHLTHPRNENSNYISYLHKERAEAELQNTASCSSDEIKKMVQSGYFKKKRLVYE